MQKPHINPLMEGACYSMLVTYIFINGGGACYSVLVIDTDSLMEEGTCYSVLVPYRSINELMGGCLLQCASNIQIYQRRRCLLQCASNIYRSINGEVLVTMYW